MRDRVTNFFGLIPCVVWSATPAGVEIQRRQVAGTNLVLRPLSLPVGHRYPQLSPVVGPSNQGHA